MVKNQEATIFPLRTNTPHPPKDSGILGTSISVSGDNDRALNVRFKYCIKAVRHLVSLFPSVGVVMLFANLQKSRSLLSGGAKTQGLWDDCREQAYCAATRKTNNCTHINC